MNNEEKILSILETLVVKVDGLEIGQAELKAGQAKLETGMARLENRVERIEDRVERIEDRVERIEDAVAKTMNDVSELKIDLSIVRKAVVAIEQNHGKSIQVLFDRDVEHHADIARLKAASL